ncbi:hypothetical protein G6F68_002535 [Rhizopus microsporus]|nr:hypothetical protein G6F67_003524 [Rhizopus microsporus]KAG1266699.1 hypothetical protein G6F68_002535 [Rhizopus microsporus]
MSAKPRHAQLIQEEHHLRRQSAPLFSTQLNHKPLPQEPIQQQQQQQQQQQEPLPPVEYNPVDTDSSIYMNPVQQHPVGFIQHHPTYPLLYSQEIHPYPQPPQTAADAYPAMAPSMYPNYPPMHPPIEYHSDLSQHEYPQYIQPTPMMAPNMTPNMMTTPALATAPHQRIIPQTLSDPPVDNKSEKKDTSAKNEKKTRQITVQSINKEHRVWIDVSPTETGLSLAEKIHIIATFRTRKIVSITTASGRKIPLDNRPVFGSWVDMENFQDGERWTVEWCENDRGVMDRLISKVVQAGGGKRHKDHIAKDK